MSVNRFLANVATGLAWTALTITTNATTIFGLTSTNGLVRFDSATPGAVTNLGIISQPGIVDIDFYPGNALLYAITGTGDTYTLNLSTGQATFRFSPSVSISDITDFDFDPVNARIGLYGSTTHQSYRMIPDYLSARHTGGMAGAITIDGSFTDLTRQLVGNAYDSPFDSAGKTNQWSIDTAGDVSVLHSGGPPDTTILRPESLGFTAGTNVGFDIGQDGVWYVSTDNDLYTIRPTRRLLGTVAGAPLVSIAVAIVPEPSSAVLLILGLTLASLPGRRNILRETGGSRSPSLAPPPANICCPCRDEGTSESSPPKL